ncbi:MAG: ATP phosphoribosyltransferase regulatory subunit, partial [Oscillospiraceae bacterium]|nr:ATP phosphoribosyltransferase regulatory subunit [Oscillospiraceae bacterium]
SDVIRIDFSVVDDLRYYNGFVFKGFAQGIPTSVLSGGQYDALMKNMKRKSGAIGFEVYLDSFENTAASSEYDVDVLLVYSENADISMLKKKADEIIANGESVLMQQEKSDSIKYKRLIIEKDGEVICIENNA